MGTPFHLELKVMWRNLAFASFIADALVHQTFHAFNELRSSQATLRLDGAAKLSVDHVAHAFKHTPQQTLRQRLFTFLLVLLLFSHSATPRCSLKKTQPILKTAWQSCSYEGTPVFYFK